MNNRMFLATTWLLTTIGVLVSSTGCANGTVAHENLKKNTEALLDKLRADKTLPRNAAVFCLERAIINYDNARYHSRFDGALLGFSAGVGASGLTMQAIGAALPTPSQDPDSSAKKVSEVIGAAGIALAAGLLTIRTAAGHSELALAQRTAAAKQVDAALALLAKYALAEDFKEVTEDGFDSCRDADVDVAKSYPGSSSGEPLQKKFSEAQTANQQKKTDAEDARAATAKSNEALAEKKQEAQKAEAELQRATKAAADASKRGDSAAAEQARKEEESARADKARADAAVTQADLQAKKAEQQTSCKEAEVSVAEKSVAWLKAASALRRALFFGTQNDVDLAKNEVARIEKEREARRKQRDAACNI